MKPTNNWIINYAFPFSKFTLFGYAQTDYFKHTVTLMEY